MKDSTQHLIVMFCDKKYDPRKGRRCAHKYKPYERELKEALGDNWLYGGYYSAVTREGNETAAQALEQTIIGLTGLIVHAVFGRYDDI